MNNLDFIKKLVNGKNCYSDHMKKEELNVIRIESSVEATIKELISNNKIVFIAGNPGDGKTYLIKSIAFSEDVYTVTDLNNVENYETVASNIIQCYDSLKPALIAANEYPFLLLERDIRKLRKDIADEIAFVRDTAIVFGTECTNITRIAVIDLNNRNLLDIDRDIPEKILDKMISLLEEDENISPALKYNIDALKKMEVKSQLLSLYKLATVENEHFAMRDILGSFAFILTACETEEYRDIPYYKAAFLGPNNLLNVLKKYDPIKLSNHTLDEKLWNGEVLEGWLVSTPTKWPNDEEFEDSVTQAIEEFQDIKRRYFFENMKGKQLNESMPFQILGFNLFTQFDSKRKLIKENIILAINKLFLPTDTDKKALHIWTTHHYNLSMETTVAVSSSYVSSNDLDIYMPRPATWLKDMEFTPSYIILKLKNSPPDKPSPSLQLDIDFLRVLEAVRDGYPVSLLPPQYVQAANAFVQQLKYTDSVDEYGEDEIIIASRDNNYQVHISTSGNKYSFLNND